MVAKISLTGAIVVRILTGIFAGPAIPVTRGSLGPWAPHDEYGRLVSLQDRDENIACVRYNEFLLLTSKYENTNS